MNATLWSKQGGLGEVIFGANIGTELTPSHGTSSGEGHDVLRKKWQPPSTGNGMRARPDVRLAWEDFLIAGSKSGKR